MKNKRQILWIIGIILTPFVLMLFLHLGIAIQQYFKFDINVPNIAAADWFMFAGSYLGGAMTMLGVIATLKHERNIHRHQQMLEDIRNEQKALCNIVSDFDVFVPLACNEEISSALGNQKNNELPDLSNAKRKILEQLSILLRNRTELHLETNMCCPFPQCAMCKHPCRLPAIKSEFQSTYNVVYKELYDTLTKLDAFATAIHQNYSCDLREHLITQIISNCKEIGRPSEYTEADIEKIQREKKDLLALQEEVNKSMQAVADFNSKEIVQMINLVREYVAVLEVNAERNCFSGK